MAELKSPEWWIVAGIVAAFFVAFLGVLRLAHTFYSQKSAYTTCGKTDLGIITALSISSALRGVFLLSFCKVVDMYNMWVYLQSAALFAFVLACSLVARKWALVALDYEQALYVALVTNPHASSVVRSINTLLVATCALCTAILLAVCAYRAAAITGEDDTTFLVLLYAGALSVNASVFVMFLLTRLRLQQVLRHHTVFTRESLRVVHVTKIVATLCVLSAFLGVGFQAAALTVLAIGEPFLKNDAMTPLLVVYVLSSNTLPSLPMLFLVGPSLRRAYELVENS